MDEKTSISLVHELIAGTQNNSQLAANLTNAAVKFHSSYKTPWLQKLQQNSHWLHFHASHQVPDRPHTKQMHWHKVSVQSDVFLKNVINCLHWTPGLLIKNDRHKKHSKSKPCHNHFLKVFDVEQTGTVIWSFQGSLSRFSETNKVLASALRFSSTQAMGWTLQAC